MKKWHEYSFRVEDTTHDQDGNPMTEVTLYLKSDANREEIISALEDYLEQGLHEEIGGDDSDIYTIEVSA